MIERIKTPFGFSSTAEDVVQSIDLTGKHAIVTGGSSGIGIETARALAMAGANTTLAVRRPDAGDATCVVKPLLTIGAKWPSPEKSGFRQLAFPPTSVDDNPVYQALSAKNHTFDHERRQ